MTFEFSSDGPISTNYYYFGMDSADNKTEEQERNFDREFLKRMGIDPK